MTESSQAESAALNSNRFRETIKQLSIEAVLADLPAVNRLDDNHQIDWGFALLCASALTRSTLREGQDAALRVAQSCISSTTEEHFRYAAAVILERLGNRPSLMLASNRGLIDLTSESHGVMPVVQDVIRRRLELSIPMMSGTTIAANQFQRQFWTLASSSEWLSVSAPTSAGKSFIVKQWIHDLARRSKIFRAVYVVPTRALIEEVSLDLAIDPPAGMRVHTIPWDLDIGSSEKEVFVLTQERFHLLQQRARDFSPQLVFIDEAQKFDDGSRGVLLQQVLDETVRRRTQAQVIFASPFSSNPQILLSGAPGDVRTKALVSDSVTVNQNLIFTNQIPGRPRTWVISVSDGEQPTICGYFELPARPAPASKRLPLVAVSLGGLRTGNVVYVNGAADAEKSAKQIYEALGSEAVIEDEDLDALRELSRTAIHPDYALDEVLMRGVAFHYGNMPLLLKTEIERLFKAEQIRYLVCTSTLLEGVNLPCRNLFVRGPRKGRGRVMTTADFWNLAGRAGRWGKEFQGNIVCVDTDDRAQWPSVPGLRAKSTIARASDEVLDRLPALIDYISGGTPVSESRAQPILEAVFSLLASRVAQGRDIQSIVGVSTDDVSAVRLEETILDALRPLTIPARIVEAHSGISPLAMQRLLDRFAAADRIEDLLLPPPESVDSASGYARAIEIVNVELGGDWGPPGRQFQLSILITQWMRGIPLARLIESRVAYARERGESVPGAIRDTMADVEQIARFQAPKYLACYQDILRFHATRAALELPEDAFLDVSMMLELGVSRPTEVSLMAIGLSRTTAVALSDLISGDAMSPQDVITWLRAQNLESLPVPRLVRRELIFRLGLERVRTDDPK